MVAVVADDPGVCDPDEEGSVSSAEEFVVGAVMLPSPSELPQALSENASATSKIRGVFLIFMPLI